VIPGRQILYGCLTGIEHGFMYRLSCMRKSLQDWRYFYAPLAQMEEHSTFNRVAMGPRSTLRSGPCWTWSVLDVVHWTTAPHMEYDRLGIEF